MKSVTVAAGAALLILSGCGPKPLSLPQDPVDRAASCGVLAAIEARANTADIKAPLPFEAQGHILHYALLAGAEGESFSLDRARQTVERMSALQEDITKGKWQELKPACEAAFPEAHAKEAKLPKGRLDAQLGCDELAGFLRNAMSSQEVEYGNELAEYQGLQLKLDRVLGPGLRSRAGSDLDRQQAVRRDALRQIAKAGSPMPLMRQCIDRFG